VATAPAPACPPFGLRRLSLTRAAAETVGMSACANSPLVAIALPSLLTPSADMSAPHVSRETNAHARTCYRNTEAVFRPNSATKTHGSEFPDGQPLVKGAAQSVSGINLRGATTAVWYRAGRSAARATSRRLFWRRRRISPSNPQSAPPAGYLPICRGMNRLLLIRRRRSALDRCFRTSSSAAVDRLTARQCS